MEEEKEIGEETREEVSLLFFVAFLVRVVGIYNTA